MKDNKIISSFLIPVSITMLFLMPSLSRETYLYDLLMNVFSVVLLGIVVWYIQGKYSDELENNRELLKTKQLQLVINSVSKRSKSRWNFINLTPTFYFDNSKLVQLYDLLTVNNRFWEQHINKRLALLK